MKINNKAERQKFLELNIIDSGSYALVTYDNHTETIWISKYTVGESGYWFLEAPCELCRYEFKDDSDKAIIEYVKELYEKDAIEEGIKYTKSMLRDGYLYDIDAPQTAPFLPDKLDDLTLISEQYCLEWMLNQNNNCH